MAIVRRLKSNQSWQSPSRCQKGIQSLLYRPKAKNDSIVPIVRYLGYRQMFLNDLIVSIVRCRSYRQMFHNDLIVSIVGCLSKPFVRCSNLMHNSHPKKSLPDSQMFTRWYPYMVLYIISHFCL